jgi:ATP-dependent helicase STH1/SNF2
MASVQMQPAVPHAGSAIPAGMTQQQAQEVYMVRFVLFPGLLIAPTSSRLVIC